MKTLNQIKHILLDFFNSHKQINTVSYERKFDFNADRNITYPVCNIEYLETNINGKKTTHSYGITLADLWDDSIEGHEDEIHSDLMLVAEDFFAFAQYYEGFDFSKSVNIQKFVDMEDDRTAGLVFKIQLSTVRSQNTCAIPLSE